MIFQKQIQKTATFADDTTPLGAGLLRDRKFKSYKTPLTTSVVGSNGYENEAKRIKFSEYKFLVTRQK